MTIRPAVPADLPAIQSIYAHHVLHGLASFELDPPTLEEMRSRHDRIVAGGDPYLVAVDGDRLLGYAYASQYRPRPAYRFTVEDSIYVAPPLAGRGIGKALLSHLIDECESRGFRQMLAVIGDSANAASIGLHRACGFELKCTLDAFGFKFGRWVDSVLMQRALGHGQSSLPHGRS
jgi:phosphinothricin acetyltransferase